MDCIGNLAPKLAKLGDHEENESMLNHETDPLVFFKTLDSFRPLLHPAPGRAAPRCALSPGDSNFTEVEHTATESQKM